MAVCVDALIFLLVGARLLTCLSHSSRRTGLQRETAEERPTESAGELSAARPRPRIAHKHPMHGVVMASN